MANHNTTSNAMIGDAREMYAFVKKVEKMVDDLLKSRNDAYKGIAKMGEGFRDNQYEIFKDEFIKFAKYIDNLNEYNQKTMDYYEKLSRVIEEWDITDAPGIKEQSI